MKTTNKLLRTALFSAMAVAGSAAISAANAGEIHFDPYGDLPMVKDQPITIACEAADEVVGRDYDLDPGVLSPLGNNTGAEILYKAKDGSLADDNKLIYHLHNAHLSDGTGVCKLVYVESAGIDTDGDGNPDTPQDANGDGDAFDIIIAATTADVVGGSSDIEFVINADGFAGGSIPQDAVLYLACETGTDDITDMDDSTAAIPFNQEWNPVIVIENPLTEVCIDVEGYKDYGAVRWPVFDAATNCFIDWECQFQLSIHPTVNMIDIYEDSESRHFVDIPGDILTSSSPTDLDAADGTIDIKNDCNEIVDGCCVRHIEDPINLDEIPGIDLSGNANFDVEIYSNRYACNNDTTYGERDYQALEFVALDNDPEGVECPLTDPEVPHLINGVPGLWVFDEGTSQTPGEGDGCKLSLSVGATTGDIHVPPGTEWREDAYMKVDGVTPMRFVRWQLDEDLTFDYLSASLNLDSSELPTDGTYEPFFKKWEHNGTTFFMPWVQDAAGVVIKFALNNPTYTTYHKVMEPPYDYDNAPHAKPGAEVRAKIWDECGNYVDNVLVGYITDQGGLVVRGKDLWNLAKAHGLTPSDSCKTINQNPNLYTDKPGISLRDPAKVGRFSAIFRVGAPERDVEASAFQATPTGQKALPIYESQERDGVSDDEMIPDSLYNLPDDLDHHNH